MRGLPDAIGLVVLLATGAAAASSTTQAAMSTPGPRTTTAAAANASLLEAQFMISGTGTGSNGRDPYAGAAGASFPGFAWQGVRTDAVPQVQPAGVETTARMATPAPTVNCSGRILNGTACPDDGPSGMAWYIILAIAVGGAVGIALLAVLIWFLATKYGPSAAKKAQYVPLIEKPADKPGDKPAVKPGDKPAVKPGDKPAVKPTAKPGDKPADAKPVAIKIIPVNLVTHMQPPVWATQ